MRIRLLVAFWMAVFLCACGSPGPGNFEKFTANENGVRQLKAYVQDESNSMDARLEAMNSLIQAGWAMQTRAILDGCRDRDELAVKLTDSLISRLPGLLGEPKKLAPVRDAAFIGLNRISDDKRLAFQQRLAAWAFEGLGPGSSAEQIKKVVEPRILVSQITDLGKPGVDGAVLMIRNGFAVDKLANYVVGLKDAEADHKLMEAFKALHAIPDIVVKFTHIDVIGKIHSPEAVDHLLDLSLDENQDPDIRAAAFNAAAATLEKPEALKGDRSGVIKRLRLLLARPNPDDRWSAARYLIAIEGFSVVPEVMKALKDDGIYPRAYEDPIKTMVDFCRQVIFGKGASDAAWKVVKGFLKSPNKVHRALGIVCVKASGDPSRANLVARLTRSRKGLEDVLGEKITVGRLARNAREGLAMMGEVKAAQKAGSMTAAQARKKQFLILVNLLDTGDDYRKAVEQRFSKEKQP